MSESKTRNSSEPAKSGEHVRVQAAQDAWETWPTIEEEKAAKEAAEAKEKSNGTNGTHSKTTTPPATDSKPDDAITATGFFSPMLAVSGIFEKPKFDEPAKTEPKAKAPEPATAKPKGPAYEETQEMPPVKAKLELDEPPLVIPPIKEVPKNEAVVAEPKPTSTHLPVVPGKDYASDILNKAASETAAVLNDSAERASVELASTDSMPKVKVEKAEPALAETQAAPPVVIHEVKTEEAKTAEPKIEAPKAEEKAAPAESAKAEQNEKPAEVVPPAPVETPKAEAAEPVDALEVPAAAETPRFQEAGAGAQPPLHETQIQPPVHVENSVSVAEGPAVELPKTEPERIEIPKSNHVAMSEGGLGIADDEPEEALPVSVSGAHAPVQPFSVPAASAVPPPAPAPAPVITVPEPVKVDIPAPAPVNTATPTPMNEPAIRIPREDRGPVVLFKSGKTGGIGDVKPKSSARLPAVESDLPPGVPAPKVGRATFTPPGLEAVQAPPPAVEAQATPVKPSPALSVIMAPPTPPAEPAPAVSKALTAAPVSLPPADSPFGSPMAALPPPPMNVKPITSIGIERPMLPPVDSPFGAGGAYISGVMEVPRGSGGTQSMPALSGLTGIFNAEAFRREAHTRVPALLVAEGLKKRFGKREVVTAVDLEVGRGEIVGLLGRNGAGKTTSFRMIVGMLSPDGGKVTFDKVEITKQPMYRRARMGIGYLAQEASIFQKLSVEQNLLAVLELQEPVKKKRLDRMDGLIHDLGLEHVRKSKAATLSGGERRRLEIARTMSLNPQVVLFDEPFAGIDPIAVTEIQDILRQLKKRNVGVLITDHNVRETLIITDRTYIMDEGKIWIHGSPREIVNNPEAKQRYLGHGFRLDF